MGGVEGEQTQKMNNQKLLIYIHACIQRCQLTQTSRNPECDTIMDGKSRLAAVVRGSCLAANVLLLVILLLARPGFHEFENEQSACEKIPWHAAANATVALDGSICLNK
jgi:hypothetical protein